VAAVGRAWTHPAPLTWRAVSRLPVPPPTLRCQGRGRPGQRLRDDGNHHRNLQRPACQSGGMAWRGHRCVRCRANALPSYSVKDRTRLAEVVEARRVESSGALSCSPGRSETTANLASFAAEPLESITDQPSTRCPARPRCIVPRPEGWARPGRPVAPAQFLRHGV